MDRRNFIAVSGATVAATLVPAALFGQAPRAGARAKAPADAALDATFERIFNEQVASSPEFATGLGLDKGANAGRKRLLSPRTAAERRADLARAQRELTELRRVDRAALSPASQNNLDVVIYRLEAETVAPARFDIDSVQTPYPIYQQGGAYFDLPDFLNSAHTIKTSDDAEAYLARLDLFATVLDQDTQEQRLQAARGFLAPGWSLDLALGQMNALRGVPAASSTMVDSLVTRARAAGVAGDWAPRATRIVEARVYPALDRQIAAIQALRPTTRPGDGAWRLPQGDAIYAAALRAATTTDFTPDEVHRMGVEQVAQITAQIDGILRAQGRTTGTVGERLAALNVEPDQLYANDDTGRAALIASLNAGVRDMTARLPRMFATLPTQPLEIRRVPVEIQDGASNGYYNRASLDGSRPAIYFINLKSTGDWPKYSLPSLTYHEGVPGHHLQISLAQESRDIPTIRKVAFFSAYAEGWALYAEQLADESGVYEGNPLDRVGFLQSFLFRAARLVVDTGLHTQRWSRERATDYMVATTGFARPRSQREVERYCTLIGQACSYKVGHMAWTRARAASKAALGNRFDLKQFHEVLREGAMPLTILEARIKARTMAQLRA